MAEVFRGTVTRLEGPLAWVLVPRLGVVGELGPCEVLTDLPALAVGSRVAVAAVNGGSEDVIVLGSLDDDGSGGARWFTGTGAPAASLGRAGDMYLAGGGAYYRKDAAAGWQAQGSLLGLSGDAVFYGLRTYTIPFDLPGTDGRPQGWDFYWSNGVTVDTDATPANVYSGSRSMRVQMPANSQVRAGSGPQPFAVVPGEVITVRVAVKGTVAAAVNLEVGLFTAAAGITPDYFTSGTTYQTQTRAVATAWAVQTFTFAVPPGDTRGRIFVSGLLVSSGTAGGTVWFDLGEAYPEPAGQNNAPLVRDAALRRQDLLQITAREVLAAGVRWAGGGVAGASSSSQSSTARIGLPSLVSGNVVTGVGGPDVTVASTGHLPLPNNAVLYYLAGVPAAAPDVANYRVYYVGGTVEWFPPTGAIAVVSRSDAVTENYLWGDGRSMSQWFDATLASPWAAPPSGWASPQYRRVEGRVELRGAANGATATQTTMFTLPAGFRPAANEGFGVIDASTGTRLVVFPDGRVQPYSVGFCALAGVRFGAAF